MIAFKITLLKFLLLFSTENKCTLLTDGNYKIKYTFNSTEVDSQIKIKNDNFSQFWNNGDSASGKIKWIYNCIFKFDYLNRAASDTNRPGNQILKSFGGPCIELNDKNGDTIFFRTTYTGNLHLTLDKGMFTKIQ